MFCPNCGALLASRGRCPVCSRASAVQSAPPTVQQPPAQGPIPPGPRQMSDPAGPSAQSPPVRASSKGPFIIVLIVVIVLLVVVLAKRASNSGQPVATESNQALPTESNQATVSPHAQRLADLRKKREGLEWSVAIGREHAKKIARDAMNLSSQPLADPDERQYLMDSMDKVEQRMAQLVAQIGNVDAEIAKEQSTDEQASASLGASRPGPRLTELRGSLARRREYDLWLIRNVLQMMKSESQQGKIMSYCMTTVYGAEQSLDSAPETEYALQPDGTVLITSGKPPKTPEQHFREGQRMQLELETGGGPLVQDCAGSLFWFGTWHNQPMPSDEKLRENAAKAKADLGGIDKMLDPRLVESLPKPEAP